MKDQSELILQFQQKDVKAYEKLYNLYCDSISGVVNNIVKNDDVAQEITQDVFIKAWNKGDTYSPQKGRFFTWLLNIDCARLLICLRHFGALQHLRYYKTMLSV